MKNMRHALKQHQIKRAYRPNLIRFAVYRAEGRQITFFSLTIIKSARFKNNTTKMKVFFTIEKKYCRIVFILSPITRLLVVLLDSWLVGRIFTAHAHVVYDHRVMKHFEEKKTQTT